MTTPTSHIDLTRAYVHWLTRDLLALPPWALPAGCAADDLTWSLAVAPQAGLDLARLAADPSAGGGSAASGEGAGDGPQVELLDVLLAPGALPHPVADGFPHLAACHPLHLTPSDAARTEMLLTGQTALLGRDRSGELRVATSVQVPGVLDDLYAASAIRRSYGPTWAGAGEGAERIPTVTVWAPTAQRVELLLWEGAPPAGSDPGVVTVGGPARGADDPRGRRCVVRHRHPGLGRPVLPAAAAARHTPDR